MAWYNVEQYKHKNGLYHYSINNIIYCNNKPLNNNYIKCLPILPPINEVCSRCTKKAIKNNYNPFNIPICNLSRATVDDNHQWIIRDGICYDEHGHRCICTGCWDEFDNPCDETVQICISNGHCLSCTCEDCVCPLRKSMHYYDNEIVTPYWDNPCHGSCESCVFLNDQKYSKLSFINCTNLFCLVKIIVLILMVPYFAYCG